MDEYQIGKDIQELTRRVEEVERALRDQRPAVDVRDVRKSPTADRGLLFQWRYGDKVEDKLAPFWWYRIGWEFLPEEADPHSITIGPDGYLGVFIVDCYYTGRNVAPTRNLKLQLSFKDAQNESLFTYTPSLKLKKDDPHVRWSADYMSADVAKHFDRIYSVSPLAQS